jgi:hypothetical protein
MISMTAFQLASRRIAVRSSCRFSSATTTSANAAAAVLKGTIKNEGAAHPKALFAATATGLVAASVALSYYREVRVESIESFRRRFVSCCV